ncbi:MAG: hypothetical protein V2I33_17580 [Kangiellaceae bacterium]|jgi:hypothetical protein|nr:hypothetical protein [Kangiellaceae bacterium]
MAEMEKQINSLEAKYLEVTRKYHTTLDEETLLRAQALSAISRPEAEKLRQNNENLVLELSEARAAMHTYKGMVTVCTDQVRALELQKAKRRYEIEVFQNTIREL